MDIFDDTIGELREWFRAKEDAGLRSYADTPSPGDFGAPGRREGKGPESPSIILKEHAHLELGHPSVGSCSAALATADTSLITKGRVSLLGPDIDETEKDQLPFAQIVLASCMGDAVQIASNMDRILHRAAQSRAYMIRSVPNLIWARVSKEGARSGFSLHRLGCRLIASLREECDAITGSEVFFVTSCREDVAALSGIVETARGRLRQFGTYNPMPDGTYECQTALDCDDCEEQTVCNSIRDIIKIRKGSRIVSLGPE